LSWFWRSWLYTTETLDQAVDSVASDSGSVASRIYLRNVGAMPMPVELELVMDDGSIRRMRLPVEVWYGGRHYDVLVPEARKVVKVTIDPKSAYPAVRRETNVWEERRTGTVGRAGATGGTSSEGSKYQ
jgi:hypothetical protein